jgi:hypothetical protein
VCFLELANALRRTLINSTEVGRKRIAPQQGWPELLKKLPIVNAAMKMKDVKRVCNRNTHCGPSRGARESYRSYRRGLRTDKFHGATARSSARPYRRQ